MSTESSNPAGDRQSDLDALRAITAGLAHEIRNPLQFIKSYAEVVAELTTELKSIVDDGREHVPEPTLGDLVSLREELAQAGEQIVRHVHRLDAIVESMSATSHQGSGQRQLTDVNLLVKESAEFAYHGRVGPLGEARTETLLFELDTSLPLAMVDPVRLSRAVINVVTNALQAASGSKAASTITVTTAPSDGGFDIAVTDDGPGIPPELHGKVFEPFFTAKPGRLHAGLGLTQVWDIVVGDHHGSVTIEGGREQGTKVILTLPQTPEA